MAHVITSTEKKCTCCLLHPVGTNLSPWFSSCLSSPLEHLHIPYLISDLARMGVISRPNISFRAHCAPKNSNCNTRWAEWVKLMSQEEKFVRTWRDAGIHDAIVFGSVSAEIKIDQQAMEALFGFWCPVTNTFTFPWGEAGLTLEDSHIFTGLPLVGSDLDRKLMEEEEELQMRLLLETEKILESRNWDGLVTYDAWLEWFMNRKDIDSEVRHLGFLTYWLCKYVFPSPDPMQDAAFGLAARLSLGEKIALAPALVAGIYHNLNVMTESHLSFQGKKVKGRGDSLKAWALFGILQCWIWERFESLRPSTQSTVARQSGVRITRWNGRQSKNKYDEAREIFQDERQFTWRPYSHRLGKWLEPEWYNMESRSLAVGGRSTPTYVDDFLAVISCTHLKGICEDSHLFSESYHPNRVARQFGFDQAIPGVADACKAPSSNEPSTKRMQIFIPGIMRCGNPRTQYTKWWYSYRTSYDEVLKESAMPRAEAERTRVSLCSNAEKREDISSKKRKVDEIGKIVPTIKEVVGCKHQEIHGITNTTTSPLYSNLQLVQQKRSDIDEPVGVLGDEDPTSFTIDSDDEDELLMYDGPPPGLYQTEEVVSVEEDECILDELNKFQTLGLTLQREQSPDLERSTKKDSSPIVERNARSHLLVIEDPYGQEAIDRYPQFFKLIPQKPHYRGILEKGNITEDMKKDIFLGQWYMLVNLMEEALKVNDHSDAAEIRRMIRNAQALERSGFDVRYLIARLTAVHSIKHLK